MKPGFPLVPNPSCLLHWQSLARIPGPALLQVGLFTHTTRPPRGRLGELVQQFRDKGHPPFVLGIRYNPTEHCANSATGCRRTAEPSRTAQESSPIIEVALFAPCSVRA